MNVLVFGNPHLPEDSLAITVSKNVAIPQVTFTHSETLNDLLEQHYDAILDVAYGVPRVVILKDLSRLREHRLVSLHDYDVSFFLKLMNAIGKLSNKPIIAIPVDYDKERAIRETQMLISELMAQPE
jgi:Ni,Fe-hydrogenase maturation factor